MRCLWIFQINPLLTTLLAKIFFSRSVDCLFVSLMVSFAVQRLLSLIESHLGFFVFVFLFITLGGGSKNVLLRCMSKCVLPLFL